MLIIGIVGSAALATVFAPASFVIGFSVWHFFLFCNVFRISRGLELIWSVIFVALAAGTFVIGFPGWTAVIVLSLCATITVVVCEMKKSSYHGIGWRKINPGLKDWWDLNYFARKNSD